MKYTKVTYFLEVNLIGFFFFFAAVCPDEDISVVCHSKNGIVTIAYIAFEKKVISKEVATASI